MATPENSQQRRYRIAVIPGDGIGKEVVPEGVRVLEQAAKRHGFSLQLDWFDFASCDYYERHGRMMPEDWKARIETHDAIFFGAVGMPERVPDHVSLWGSLILFRREFDQYANLRPVRLMPGVKCPLADREPGDIDFWVVRENTEGEYSNAGGRMFAGTEREFALQETIMTRHGTDRILRFAFELAQKRPKKHLTSATKSNGISITMPYWDERVKAVAGAYPDVRWDQYHIDILTAHFVLNPDRFDVVSPPTCSATSCRIWGRPARARSASRRPATSTRSGCILPCSSRSTARRRTSPGRGSPTRSARSGRGR